MTEHGLQLHLSPFVFFDSLVEPGLPQNLSAYGSGRAWDPAGSIYFVVPAGTVDSTVQQDQGSGRILVWFVSISGPEFGIRISKLSKTLIMNTAADFCL